MPPRSKPRYLLARWAEPIAPTLFLLHTYRRESFPRWVPRGGLSEDAWKTLLDCLSRPFSEEEAIRQDIDRVLAVLRLDERADVSRSLNAVAMLALAELDRYHLLQVPLSPSRDVAVAKARRAVLAARRRFCEMYDTPRDWDAMAQRLAADHRVSVGFTRREVEALQETARAQGMTLQALIRGAALAMVGDLGP